ncbi:hypothetical protein NEMBOFW57_002835 [Staphylotrichum longicolle]|uniref:Sodium/calcium exchanger membrane region domain-containing protein n=1 Tax=Staphylotrichum longicolle TaxID=669026 RepID=A0AAD4F6S6_9PEZI|nr:hypothetical protein NEMBOFW57_002835 [Staphylotrichum longicolle]
MHATERHAGTGQLSGPAPFGAPVSRSSRASDGSGHEKEQPNYTRSTAAPGVKSTVPSNLVVRFLLVIKHIFRSSVVNILLVFVPAGIAVHFAQLPAGVIFAMNAVAIVPLAALLSHATESVASRLGDTVGALMNVTFGNAAELIIFIIALVKNHIRIVQASLVGSILVNLLLILGMCFLLGGLRFREQIYNSTVTQMSACLLALSVTSLLLPTAFHASFSSETTADDKVLQPSAFVGQDPSPSGARMGTITTRIETYNAAHDSPILVLLLISTGLVAVCAEFMVSSIDKLVATDSGLSEAFIGLILLPIVGNAAEHVTAVSVAMKNKMDLAIGVAVGSSIQIALFVTPLIVILGWVLGKDMSLFFTLFETVCVFVSAFIVNFLVLDGRSNYLEGALLCAGYVIIAVAAFFYPEVKPANALGGGD